MPRQCSVMGGTGHVCFRAVAIWLTLQEIAGASDGICLSFNIVDFGAKEGGVDLCTPAINRAVAAARAAVAVGKCAEADVVVPTGKFLTGAFSLASGVFLRLDSGAVLLASTRAEDYPATWWNWDPALVDTANSTRTGFRGEGAIDGQQALWATGFDKAQNQFVPRTWTGVNGCVGECRPKLVRFVDCVNVTVTGVTLRNSPDWTQLYRRCTGVLLQGLTVSGSTNWPNNDGVDFESGEDIRVLDSVFTTGDDGIVFASGNTNQNRVPSPGLPLRGAVVRNCTIESKSCAIKLEAIDFGGCDHGSLEDISVSAVRIRRSSRGVGFQLRNGRGSMRNVSFSNLEIETVYPTGSNWWGSAEPIWVTNVNSTHAEGLPGRLGTIANVVFDNVTAVAENAALLSGIGRPIGPITLRNVSLTLAVIGNATCGKGMLGVHSGCTDYRPVDRKPSVVLGSSAGLRIEGSGSVSLHGVTVRMTPPIGQPVPPYWLPSCVDRPTLPPSLDPNPQRFDVTGDPVECVRGRS